MKKTVIIAVAMLTECAFATPSSNNFHAVTNDWYNGNFSNVYELAQMRLAANSNDVAGAFIMMEWDTCFSDFSAMSNSVNRLIRSADLITSPAVFTNRYARMRDGYVYFRDVFLPAQVEEEREQEQQKDQTHRTHLLCSQWLELLWDNNLW